jgi:hypothetical protein
VAGCCVVCHDGYFRMLLGGPEECAPGSVQVSTLASLPPRFCDLPRSYPCLWRNLDANYKIVKHNARGDSARAASELIFERLRKS